MDDLHLQQLITEICQLPEHSNRRRWLIDRLIRQLYNHPQLIKSYHQNYPDTFYITLEWFVQNICFHPEFIYTNKLKLFSYINNRIKWRMIDYYREQKRFLDVDIEKFPARDISLIDTYIEEKHTEEIERIGLALENYIKQDPDNKLRKIHPQGYPDCNCQVLAIRRLLINPPEKFGELSKDLKISYGTMTAHWYRRCKPILQEIAKELGYQPDEEW